MSDQAPVSTERAGLEDTLDEVGAFRRRLAALARRHPAPGWAARVWLACAVLTWAPLLVASLADDFSWTGRGSFLQDAGTHVRALLALPLLVIAERVVPGRLCAALRYLEDAELLYPKHRARARALAHGIRDVRASAISELALLVVVVLTSVLLTADTPPVPTWSHPEASDISPGPLSTAGWIDLAWSAAIYRYFLARWILQLALWSLLLVGLARLPLRTSPVHHDRAGGLGPLVEAHESYAWVVFAVSSALAARLAVDVRLAGGDPFAYGNSIGIYCLLVPFLFLAPTLAFVWPLERDRRRVLAGLSIAAAEHARRFTREYVDLPRRPLELGETDVTINADFTPGFERVYAAWALPFRREHYFTLVAAAAVPMLGFFLASVPLHEVIQRLRGLLG